MFQNQMQDKELLASGKGQISIPNRLIRTFVEYRIASLGGVVNYFNNKTVVVVDLLLVIKLCGLCKSQIEDWISSLNLAINDGERNAFVTDVMKKKDDYQ